jgi:thiol-disulfide isomerase/thioredoxin
MRKKLRIRSLVSGLLVLLALQTPVYSASLQILPDGQGTVTAFSIPDLKGKTHALNDYRGKVVLVNFWASWCLPCIQEMPALTRLGKTLGNEPFEVLTVNVGEPKFKVWKFTRLIDFDLPVLLDERKQLFDAWDARILPTSYLLDRDGVIRYRVEGVPDWENDATLSVIRKLIN